MRNKRVTQRIVASLVMLAGVLAGTMVVLSAQAPPQKVSVLNEGSPKAIPGQYIVVFKQYTAQGVSRTKVVRQDVLAAQEMVKKLDGRILFTYTSALVGFSAKLPPKALEAVRAMPGVAYIEADQKITLDTIETNPPAGLDRIDRRLLPLNNTYTYSETGLNVNAYVIDTGIRVTHTEFGGRATGAFTAINDGNGTNDCQGHGTHVAGTIGGATFGVAKQVNLLAVRVLDCTGSGTVAGVVSGVDFVTTNAVHPAVANMSLGGPQSTALDTAVTNSIATGVTYAVAAGNSGANACGFSPADVATAITVGATDPTNDTEAGFSNFGPCVRLFGPGVNILSAGIASDTATNILSGTSQATPHVSGVAARFLQNNPLATPAAVFAAIHAADDVFPGTPGWPGVINLGAGSPNELLHWGSLNNGLNDGDPHMTTVEGIRYDFQGAGEFVVLRDADGLEIQTRQAPIATSFNPGADAHDGLATCVSLNTAVAAHVGQHRVTYEPNLSGVPDPNGLQLRVDGVLNALGPAGLDLGDGGRIAKTSAPGGLQVDFPDQTTLVVTPGWWPTESKWYLNVDVSHSPAEQGVMGVIPQNSWLPALPDGTSMGSMPGPLHDRYVALYQKFADAWRVTNGTSLFDYAPGTSTDTFTMRSWPLENPPCVLPHTRPVPPASKDEAERACLRITNKDTHANCVFDVMVTGNIGFAKTYLLSQRIQTGSTRTALSDDEDPTQVCEWVTFTAAVAPNAETAKGVPTGAVQFILDGSNVGAPVKLDSKGRAIWETSHLKVGENRVAASYIPSAGSEFEPSISVEKIHTVKRCFCEGAPGDR